MIGESKTLCQKLMGEAFERYIEHRTWACYKDLVQSLLPVWMYTRGITMAAFEELTETFHFSFFKSLFFHIGILLFRVLSCRRNTPQYNDYLMAKWKLHGRCDLVKQMLLRLRSNHLKPEVQASCEWMVNSVCEQDEFFNSEVQAVISELEAA